VGSAYRLKFALPRYLPDALDELNGSDDLREVLGDDFVSLVVEVKQAEHRCLSACHQRLGARASAAECLRFRPLRTKIAAGFPPHLPKLP
jgi:glutamine synthetase